jgi:hypothetical protein
MSCGKCKGKVHVKWECYNMINHRHKKLEGRVHAEVDSGMTPIEDKTHGYDPTMEVRYDTSGGESSDYAHLMAHTIEALTLSNGVTYGGDMVEDGEHGNIHSPMEAHGIENIESTLICLNDDMVPIPCEDESHIDHLSESKSEMSDSTVCEIECFHFEGMCDTPSEMRVVVDRSMEDISNANYNLPSTSSVFSYVVLGCMNDKTLILDERVPHMEKMYMVDEDDASPCTHGDEEVAHMKATTTSTPTS